MKANFIEPPICHFCLDLELKTNCAECLDTRTKEVEVLSIGVGILGDKAVIKHPNGKIETVGINDLTIIG